MRHARGRVRGADRGHGRDQRGDAADVQPVAVVTGGSSGIGAATARALAAAGWRCVLLARGRERLERVAAEIGGEWELCDVAVREQVDEAAAAVSARHPAVRLLVHSAGVPGRSDFLGASPEQIETVLRTNYLGNVWTVRAFLPALERARPADVVNVVSVAGLVSVPASGPYSASKHAQLAFSRSVAAQLRGRGVRVHTVNPGFVETEGFPQRNVLAGPLGRAALEPERIAEHILSVLRRDRRETVVPAWYRTAALAQALAPTLTARLLGSARYRRMQAEKRRERV